MTEKSKFPVPKMIDGWGSVVTGSEEILFGQKWKANRLATSLRQRVFKFEAKLAETKKSIFQNKNKIIIMMSKSNKSNKKSPKFDLTSAFSWTGNFNLFEKKLNHRYNKSRKLRLSPVWPVANLKNILRS